MKKTIWFMLILLLMTGCSYNPSDEDIVDTFMKFVDNVSQGTKDKIRIVRYTTEGDPILHDLEYDGKIITSTTDTTGDKFGNGNVSTTTCKSIDVKESDGRTDYDLIGCDQTNRDNSILVVRK